MPTIKVSGMSCEHCSSAVTRALSALDGVSGVIVDLQSGDVTYEADGTADMGAVKAAIENAGFRLG